MTDLSHNEAQLLGSGDLVFDPSGELVRPERLTSEQRKELQIQGDPESIVAKLAEPDDDELRRMWKAGELRVVTDHTGQKFTLPA